MAAIPLAAGLPSFYLAVFAGIFLLSLIAFAACVWDKRQAIAGRPRVPEATLLGLALVGGSPGLLLGMVLVRHKTRKPAFLAPFVGIMALQLAAAWWFVLR